MSVVFFKLATVLSPRSYQVLGSFDHKILFIHFSGDDSEGFQEEGRLQAMKNLVNPAIKSLNWTQ